MDLSAVFFHLLFKNPSESIEYWNLVKIQHLHEGYLDVYKVVNNYYDKHSELPSFTSISLSTRSEKILAKIASIKKLNIEDELNIEIIVDALVNEHIQTEALNRVEKLVKSITLLDSIDIIEEFNSISMELEEQTPNTGTVSNMADLLISNTDEVATEQTWLGVNDYIDEELKVMTTELVMLGGGVGSGKSVTVCNMACSEYEQNNVGLFFSIEMRRQEIFNRFMSILSGVSNTHIRHGTLSDDEYKSLAEVRKNMFVDADSIFERYLETKDYRKFELELIKHKKLKEDNQLIIVDNQRLTLTDIDSILTKQKSIFGHKLKTCQIDYVNQIYLEADQYDWKAQISLSKKLKDLARKHEISIITPYQIDKETTARFSKGLLDAADLAFVLTVKDNFIDFTSKKLRSGPAFVTKSQVDWNSLRIDPTRVSETISSDDKDTIAMAKGVMDDT